MGSVPGRFRHLPSYGVSGVRAAQVPLFTAPNISSRGIHGTMAHSGGSSCYHPTAPCHTSWGIRGNKPRSNGSDQRGDSFSDNSSPGESSKTVCSATENAARDPAAKVRTYLKSPFPLDGPETELRSVVSSLRACTLPWLSSGSGPHKWGISPWLPSPP